MRVRFPVLSSLQTRLAVGAALIAATALGAAALVVRTGQVTQASLGQALATEQRIDLATGLASRISAYGLLLLDATRSAEPAPAVVSRLEEEARGIREQIDVLDAAYSLAVAAAAGLDGRTRIATTGMGTAKMRSAFEQLTAAVQEDLQTVRRRNDLELFVASFSPVLNALIEAEYRVRAAAFDRIETLRRRSFAAAVAMAGAALALLAGFVALVVRPIFRRLDVLLGTARRMAAGDLDVALPEGMQDEFGPLYDATSRLARRLSDEGDRVAADRARLNEIVEDRTAQLREANARLAKIDTDRRRLFADISHELRTPLTVILMEADLADREGDAAASLDVIRQRARRLTQRVDDMLRVARSTSGRIELDRASIDLAVIVKATVEDSARQAARAGVAVEILAQAPVPAYGDPNWTRQVLEGLIDNALRHAASGGRIRVVAEQGPDGPRLCVIDNGPGTGGDPVALFERFRRGGGGRSGFGIGLALARWIVEEQGGRIAAESPVPDAERLGDAPGTRVTVTLPEAP